MNNLHNLISQYFKNDVSLEKVVEEAERQGMNAQELIDKMKQWRILLESEHAEDMVLLTKEAEAAINSMMGDKK